MASIQVKWMAYEMNFHSNTSLQNLQEILYAIVKRQYEASGQYNKNDFYKFCGQLTHATQLEMLYLHESLITTNNL